MFFVKLELLNAIWKIVVLGFLSGGDKISLRGRVLFDFLETEQNYKGQN